MSIFRKIFNPAWDKVLKQVINLLFLLFGNRIREYKAIIINVLTVALGAIGIIASSETLDFFCRLNIEAFCGGEGSLFYGYVLAFIGLINLILDKVGADEIAENPAAFRVGGGALRGWAITGLFGLIILLISLFFV